MKQTFAYDPGYLISRKKAKSWFHSYRIIMKSLFGPKNGIYL